MALFVVVTGAVFFADTFKLGDIFLLFQYTTLYICILRNFVLS